MLVHGLKESSGHLSSGRIVPTSHDRCFMWRLTLFFIVLCSLAGCEPKNVPEDASEPSRWAKVDPREILIEHNISSWGDAKSDGSRDFRMLFRFRNPRNKFITSITIAAQYGEGEVVTRTFEDDLFGAGKLSKGMLLPRQRSVIYDVLLPVPEADQDKDLRPMIRVTAVKKLVRDNNFSDPNQVQALIAYGRPEEVRESLEANPKLLAYKGSDGETLFHLAAMQHDPTMLRELRELGLDPQATTESGRNLFDFAAVSTPRMVAAISKLGVRPAADSSPIFQAIVAGRADQIPALAEAGVPVDTPERGGRTPLIEAILEGDVDSARALVQLGASPKTLDDAGITPLRAAFRWYDEGYWGDILGLCGGLETENSRGETVVFHCFYLDEPQAVDWVVSKGANLQHRDLSGKTVVDRIEEFMKRSKRGEQQYGELLLKWRSRRLL